MSNQKEGISYGLSSSFTVLNIKFYGTSKHSRRHRFSEELGRNFAEKQYSHTPKTTMIDLDLRSSRFDKDQQKRRDEAKRKKAKEVELLKEQARRETELAARAAQRREEMEQAELARQLAVDAENMLTGGIKFFHNLKPYLIEGEDDKVILPELCLTELTQQDAFGRGALSFQLSSAEDSMVTHCGVREFSAPDGKIGIPPKVLASISAGDITTLSTLQIKFVLLPKCTFAKLQPKHNNFIEVGPVKQCLEENLRFHTTLSVGDQLAVWYRGKAHELCVTEMRPADRGSLVDTDVEIDLELSEEYLRHAQTQQGVGQATGHSAGQSTGSTGHVSQSSSGRASPAVVAPTIGNEAVQSVFRASAAQTTATAQPTNDGIAALAADVSARQAEYASLLAAEPSSADKDVIALKIKLPNGQTKLRRFPHSSAFAQLFLYVALEILQAPGASGDIIEKLQISTRFPARTLRLSDVHTSAAADSSGTDKTFADIGLAAASEAVFVSIV